ncbi:uncharacterized protein METZ01_LOCUS193958 [marine metagenome]|uniref:Uncharacterized protein n=1 Tax=marine metagenome TaxID=408172 RepID=A0A382DT33_9ZZZZ
MKSYQTVRMSRQIYDPLHPSLSSSKEIMVIIPMEFLSMTIPNPSTRSAFGGRP